MSEGVKESGDTEGLASLQLGSDRRLSMMALGLMAAPALWFARHDGAVFSLDWSSVDGANALRAFSALIPVAGLALVSTVRNRAIFSRVIFLTAAGIAASFILGAATYGSATPMRAPLLALVVMYVGLPNTLWRQLAPALAMSISLLLFDALPLSVATGTFASGALAFVAFNTLGCLAVARRLQLEHRVEQAWRREQDARIAAERAVAELDQLRGIIPICSHCRRVRTEVGGWQQLEQYVRDRSSADFSHGVCPSCFEVHYSEAGA